MSAGQRAGWRERLLQFLFNLLYHQLAWSYDLVAAVVSLGHWQAWVLSVLPYLTGPHILELGPGPGHVQAALLARGRRAVGLEASPQMARQARRKLERAGFTSAISRGQAQALPYPAESFDQVVATFPSDYIIDPLSLAEIQRVLKPGGELLVLPTAWLTRTPWFTRFWQPDQPQQQAAPNRFEIRLQAAGFMVKSEIVQGANWEARLICGRKV